MLKTYRSNIEKAVFVVKKEKRRGLRPNKITGHVKTYSNFDHNEEGDKPAGGLFNLDANTLDRVEDAQRVALARDASNITIGDYGENYKHMASNNFPFLTPKLRYEFELELDMIVSLKCSKTMASIILKPVLSP
jgi:hypothetical protein